MPDETQSALTPDEWANSEAGFEYWGTVRAHSDGALTVRTIDQPAIFRGHERHALAALALHGQDFGFTHDDVREVVAAAQLYREWLDPNSDTGTAPAPEAARLRDLAARLAALLPPEG